MTNQTAVTKEDKRFDNIANETWDGLKELGVTGGRFQVRPKAKVSDIASIAKEVHVTAEQDDSIIQKNIMEEEQRIAQYEAQSEKASAAAPVAPVIAVETVQAVKQTYTEAPVIQKEEAIVKQSASVTPQTTPTIASPIRKADGLTTATKPATPQVTEKKLNVLKFMGKGFAHIYFTKTNSLLMPVKFMANNYKKVFMTLIQLGVPALFTWYITTNVAIIATQINEAGAVMSVICTLSFYMASVFLFYTLLALLSMFGNMIKREALEVAKIGKEN